MSRTKKTWIELKEEFLNDQKICKENRELYAQFLGWLEYKLLRKNNLQQLDDSSYKTLKGYVYKIRNINAWFDDKNLKELTKEDIKGVYDELEAGKIKNQRGQRFRDRRSYYNKIFKSKLFRMAGKDDLAREALEFYAPNGDGTVRFIPQEEFLKITDLASRPTHKLLLWLAFDVGENINALLRLRKRDCVEQTNPDTKGKEYRIVLATEILKRSRTARTEITNYAETAKYLDLVLKDRKDEDLIFPFGYRQAKKMLDRLVGLSKVRCTPKGEPVTWKDLRSSMACDLLRKGWTTDEVNSRLGHRPSSAEIDKYVNFLAIDRHKPKKKMQDDQMMRLKVELEQVKQREKLYQSRLESANEEFTRSAKEFKAENLRMSKQLKAAVAVVRDIASKAGMKVELPG